MATWDKKGYNMEVSDTLMSKIGAAVELGRGNNLFAFASKRVDKRKDYSKGGFTAQTPTLLHEIQWNQMLHNASTRKLVNESQGIFLSLQSKLLNSDDLNVNKESVLTTSHKYRSVLSACMLNLQKVAESATEDSVKEDFIAQGELFYTIELIWNLCEVLYIDVQPSGLVLNGLLEWVRWHNDEGDKRANEAMEFETPENQNSYWEAIYCYTFLGMMESTRKLLKIHTDASRDDFVSLDELLRKMPVYHSNTTQTIGEFNIRWRFWQDECSRRWKNGEFSSAENLENICRILCGDREIFAQLSECCGSWYYLMAALLLYTDPCIKAYNLHSVAKECIEIYGGSSRLQEVDYILLAAMEFDITKVLQELCFFPDGWWFVAHLVDLMHHSGQLQIQEICYSPKMREFLLTNYASSLFSHKSLWQVGVSYLENCPQSGSHFLEVYLERLPLETEAKAWKILHIAEKKEMTALTNNVCKMMARKALRNKQIGSAVMWAVRGKDSSFASYLADRFLEEYAQKGVFSNLDLLDTLGSCMLVSDRLTFLGKYREFHRVYAEQDFGTASNLLVSLLASNLAPKYFWMTLLLDAIPLLEAEELIMSSQQTNQLLYCLEELIGSKFYHEAKGPTDDENSEKVSLLRLSLARNLARAFIEEGTSYS